MGLLDDAIREHLDLKRRRGADPTEVERAEREALGPVRRAPEGNGEDFELEPQDVGEDFELEPEAEAPPAYDHDFEAGSEDAPRRAGVVFEDDEPDDPGLDEAAAFPAEEPLRSHDVLEDRALAPEEPEDRLEGEPEPESHETDPEPSSRPVTGAAGGETVEYDVGRELGREKTEGGEDVLEETPEFLQDTPDHDRLWFEQRPPKDFDFDD
jgi:hypothetical protein